MLCKAQLTSLYMVKSESKIILNKSVIFMGTAEWRLLNSPRPMQSHSPHILMLAILTAREQSSLVQVFLSIYQKFLQEAVEIPLLVNFSLTDKYFSLKMFGGETGPIL